MIKTIVRFVKEAWQELGKVTWPTRRTALQLTLGVILLSAIFAVVIGVIDIGLSKGMESLLVWLEVRQQPTQDSQSVQVSPEDIQVETTPISNSQ